MKTSIVFLLICLTTGVSSAQSDLNTAIGKGDISGISGYLGEKVELTIGGKEENLAKSVAVVRLREFYATHAPKGFKVMHSGNDKGKDTNYAIGELATDKGNFRVYIYYIQQGQKQVVAELRFE
jgi:hypothetical protein